MPGDLVPPTAPTVVLPRAWGALPLRLSIAASAPAKNELSCTANTSLVTLLPLAVSSTITKCTFGY